MVVGSLWPLCHTSQQQTATKLHKRKLALGKELMTDRQRWLQTEPKKI
jgi:hypothetical protein